MTVNTAEYWTHVQPPGVRMNRAFRPVASALVRSGWRIRTHRADLVPRNGPVILAANHTSVLDGPLLYAIVRRPVHALVKQEMFVGPLNPGLRAIGQIPVNRYACDPAAVKACLAVLARGDAVAIYPEGLRGAGNFARVKPGVAYLAMCTGAPIVPVAILGTRIGDEPINGLPPLRRQIDMVFGEPITVDRIAWPRRQHLVRARTEDVAERLRAHVRQACELSGQRLPQGPESVAQSE